MSTPTTAQHFRPAFFRFLSELENNNERDWFHANQERFEHDVREPARAFIRAVAPRLAKISPYFVADDAKVGGSLMRIQRDTRFASDKTPYKTSIGMRFHHQAGKESGTAAGFFLGLSNAGVKMGAGFWQPPTPLQNEVRTALVADPAGWRRVAHGKRFREAFELEGESLKRPPRGFAPDHPLVEDLKRKSFVGFSTVPRKAVTSDDFVDTYFGLCKTAAPLVRFLTAALGQPF